MAAIFRSVFSGLALFVCATGLAYADSFAPIPEPGVMELAAIGAAAALAVARFKRRK